MPNRETFNSPTEYLEYYKKYREKNIAKFRKYNKEYNRLWRKRNNFKDGDEKKRRSPEKRHAWSLLNLAVKKGLIKRGKCEICKMPNSLAHHDDYFKPLDVRWLCELHHTRHHENLLRIEKNKLKKLST